MNYLEEQFVYYFYASNDPEGKQLFIDSTVYNDQLKERLQHYVDQDTNKYSDMSAFKFKSDALSDSENQKLPFTIRMNSYVFWYLGSIKFCWIMSMEINGNHFLMRNWKTCLVPYA